MEATNADPSDNNIDNLNVPHLGRNRRLGRRLAMYRDVVRYLENRPGSNLLFYSAARREGVALNLSNAKELILGD